MQPVAAVLVDRFGLRAGLTMFGRRLVGDPRLEVLPVAGRYRISGSALFPAAVGRQLGVRGIAATDSSILLVEQGSGRRAERRWQG